jgi:hypothetical protein
MPLSMKSKPEFGILPLMQLNLSLRRAMALLIALLAIGLQLIPAGIARAQDATPVPLACDLEPRPVTFIVDLLMLPEPDVTPTPIEHLPDGTGVTDQAVRADVVRVVEQLILCVNQGEFLRSFALYDDVYLRRLIDPAGVMTEEVAVELGKSFDSAEPVDPAEATVLEEVLSVRQLADGTMAVVFRTSGETNRDAGEPQIDLFVLKRAEDRWLIVDGAVDIDADELTPGADQG